MKCEEMLDKHENAMKCEDMLDKHGNAMKYEEMEGNANARKCQISMNMQ